MTSASTSRTLPTTSGGGPPEAAGPPGPPTPRWGSRGPAATPAPTPVLHALGNAVQRVAHP
eukprot:6854726-Lingulodinium_polyedra.AAC.1